MGYVKPYKNAWSAYGTEGYWFRAFPFEFT